MKLKLNDLTMGLKRLSGTDATDLNNQSLDNSYVYPAETSPDTPE